MDVRNGITSASFSVAPGLLALTVLFLESCGPQTPAFNEDKVTSTRSTSQDVVAKKDQRTGVQDVSAKSSTTISTASSTAGSSSGSSSASGSTAGSTVGTTSGGLATTSGSTSSGSTTSGNPTYTLVNQSFIQHTQNKVDILWIVDSSGSMAAEQDYLGTNFGAMINALLQNQSSFQTAVTTTDICQNVDPSTLPLDQRYCPVDGGGSAATHLQGQFIQTSGNPAVLGNFTPNLMNVFSSYTHVGVNGSGFEHGLKAAQLAVQKTLTGANANLIRPDAFLSVIVVSDEDDNGIVLSQTDPYSGENFWNLGLTRFKFTDDDFIAYIKSVKGIGNFAVSGIVGTRNADGSLCTAPSGQAAQEGTQYIKAAQKTGGTIQSICSTNWNTSLTNIGSDMGAQSNQFVLNANPINGSIRVTVNGAVETHFSYTSGNNAIRFDVGHVPVDGDQVNVQFNR